MRRKLIVLITLIVFSSSLQMYSPGTASATNTLLHNEAPGTVITFSGKQWIILDQMENGETYVLLNYSDCEKAFDLDGTIYFDPNDFNNVGYYLNHDFLNSLSNTELIADHSWEIIYTNGSGALPNVNCKIGLLDYYEYLNYSQEYFGSVLPGHPFKYGYVWWLRTPIEPSWVYVVNSTCTHGFKEADEKGCVRPAFYFKSGTIISPNKEVVIEEDPPDDPPDDPPGEDPPDEDPPDPGEEGSIFSAFQRIIDSVFDPAIQILTAARDKLDNIALVAARGLNLDYFLGPISMLGWQWRTLIVSVVASAFLLLTVLVVRKLYALYLALKEGVKWW